MPTLWVSSLHIYMYTYVGNGADTYICIRCCMGNIVLNSILGWWGGGKMGTKTSKTGDLGYFCHFLNV